MQVTAQDVANILGGKVVGDPATIITGPGKIEEAIAGNISFLSNPKYTNHVYTTDASAVLVSEDFEPEKEVTTTLIKVKDVYTSLGVLLQQFGQVEHGISGVSDQAIVDPSARLGDNVSIAPGVVIAADVIIGNGAVLYPQVYIGKGTEIGVDTILYAGVKVMHGCFIGSNCIIWSNTVIGSDGFGFSPDEERKYNKIPQIGNVIIKNDVEIGANCAIDRATMGSTIIHEGVKLDNLIQVAHNVEIGGHTVIAGQAGIAGSSKVGKHVVVGGQVAISGHLTIADGAMIQGKSGVGGNIKEENSRWFGTPAIDYRNYLRSYAHFRNLPDMAQKMKSLEKEIAALKKSLGVDEA